MANVDISSKALRDPRFRLLGQRMGASHFDALGRMAAIWSYCTDHETHIMDAEIIDLISEFKNFSELICDEKINLAQKTRKGIRIKGTKGRIEWLANLRKNASKGGKAKSAKWHSKNVASGTKNIVPDECPITITTSPTSTITTTKINTNTVSSVLAFDNKFKFDFNRLFDLYPRFHKRGESLLLMASTILSDQAYKETELAIKNYADHCKAESIELRFIMTFPTFFRERQDWVNPPKLKIEEEDWVKEIRAKEAAQKAGLETA